MVLRVFWFLYDVIWTHTLYPLLVLLYNMTSKIVLALWSWLATLMSMFVAATTEAVTGFVTAINDALLYFSGARSSGSL